jgi:hypothetical protein
MPRLLLKGCLLRRCLLKRYLLKRYLLKRYLLVYLSYARHPRILLSLFVILPRLWCRSSDR